MANYSIAIVGQAIGVLLWSFLNAGILRRIARTQRNWNIRFQDAYLVSIKAGFFAVIVTNVIILAITAIGLMARREEETILVFTSVTAFVVSAWSWWFAHSRALLALAKPTDQFSLENAKAMSSNVLVYFVLFVLAICLLIVGVSMISNMHR